MTAALLVTYPARAGARAAALASDDAAAVFGDIATFTDVTPTPLALTMG